MKELSLWSINKKSPYEVKRALNGDYVFQTEKGVIYGVGFLVEEPLGNCETRQLSIRNINNFHAAFDPNVKLTIILIIDEFFNVNMDCLLYICDTSDKREAARNRLFMKWFEESAEKGRFSIRTANAEIEGQGFYAAVIVENRNPKVAAILEDFTSSAEMLTGSK